MSEKPDALECLNTGQVQFTDAFGVSESSGVWTFTIFTFFVFAERKVQPNEFPHALYIANYSTAASTCLILKRWLFDPARDTSLLTDPQAIKILFGQVR